MFDTLNAESAYGHRALAALVIGVYAVCVAASVARHGDRNKTKHVMMRAVSLLRDAARSSLRADREGADPAEAYADAARARIYVAAVDRLLSAEDVAYLTGISLDKMREYVDEQLTRAKAELPRCDEPPPQQSVASPAAVAVKTSLGSSNRRSEGWEAAYAPSHLDSYATGMAAPLGKNAGRVAKPSRKW